MNGKSIWSEIAAPLGLLVFFVLAFWGVLSVSKRLTEEPIINLSSSDQIVTEQSEVPITGTVENTTVLRVAGSETPVANDGSFSVVVPVEVGENNIEIVAGEEDETRKVVTITRENIEPATTTTTTPTSTTVTSSESLTSSGPVETLMGSIGLSSILVSLIIFRRSMRQNSLQKA